MGNDMFAPYYQKVQCFKVKNIGATRKVVRIFQYPILWNHTRDLLQIPGVGEDDIRASLLKGEIRNKILQQEITVTCSDIDLLQFNETQLEFLQMAGITNGLYITVDQAPGFSTGGVTYDLKYNISLIGLQNGQNRVFYTPDIFIDGYYMGNEFHIEVFHNGRKLLYGSEFTISESGGPGTGFNTINFLFLVPTSSSTLRVNYAVAI
jgi:hypothetical protein